MFGNIVNHYFNYEVLVYIAILFKSFEVNKDSSIVLLQK